MTYDLKQQSLLCHQGKKFQRLIGRKKKGLQRKSLAKREKKEQTFLSEISKRAHTQNKKEYLTFTAAQEYLSQCPFLLPPGMDLDIRVCARKQDLLTCLVKCSGRSRYK